MSAPDEFAELDELEGLDELGGLAAAPDPPARAEARVSTFELFFDLVFVFALTQITGSLAADPTWSGLGEGLLIFAMLWWAWGSFAWLTNAVPTDEVLPRLLVLAAMGALLVAALAVPTTFGDSGVAFALAYLVVSVLHGFLFALAADDPASVRPAIGRLAITNLTGAILILLAGTTDGSDRVILWMGAVAVTYAGPYLTGVAGFTARPVHFVERHGLIVIIALGESIVAIGAAESGDVEWDLAGAAIVAIALASGLWWAYFDGESEHAEHALERAQGVERSRLARDVYSYLHIPLVLGVMLVALGIKKTLAGPDEDLKTVVAVALGGGVALYFAALCAIRLRCRIRPRPAQLLAVVLAVAIIPLATAVPALAALSALALVTLVAASINRLCPEASAS